MKLLTNEWVVFLIIVIMVISVNEFKNSLTNKSNIKKIISGIFSIISLSAFLISGITNYCK